MHWNHQFQAPITKEKFLYIFQPYNTLVTSKYFQLAENSTSVASPCKFNIFLYIFQPYNTLKQSIIASFLDLQYRMFDIHTKLVWKGFKVILNNWSFNLDNSWPLKLDGKGLALSPPPVGAMVWLRKLYEKHELVNLTLLISLSLSYTRAHMISGKLYDLKIVKCRINSTLDILTACSLH